MIQTPREFAGLENVEACYEFRRLLCIVNVVVFVMCLIKVKQW